MAKLVVDSCAYVEFNCIINSAILSKTNSRIFLETV